MVAGTGLATGRQLMSDVAVFYLARFKEGFAAFDAFAQSLRKHPAGLDHDLIIICKGFQHRAAFALLATVFEGIPYRITEVDDDIGQDIHSYKAAAARFPHTYACFINSFTEIKSDDWLKKLFDALSLPRVGMVGVTASFESLNNSYQAIHTVSVLAGAGARYDQAMRQSFSWIIGSGIYSARPTLKSRYRRFRRFIGDMIYNRAPVSEILPECQRQWGEASAKGAPFHFAAQYPQFPNPHIRSNVFMLRREEVVAMPLADGDPKLAGCAFESGADGLSARILKRGERLLLVGGNGKAYDIPEWMNSGCFRSRDQENLLAVDNQTKAFDSYSEPEREIHRMFAWGSYLDRIPGAAYGVSFDNLRPLSDFTTPSHGNGKARFLSIVIPTHNRLELTIDAIKTVQEQDYQNWEVVVFDNASKQDVGAAIRVLNDDRIKCERSDQFLPVTQSWNRALNMARGEYVTLIGDDDGLAPGFFARVNELADRFNEPDVVFSALFQFFHPGVLPNKPLGVVQTLPTGAFMKQRDYPFILDRESARRAVDSSLNARRTFMFNMPAFTVRRDFLDSLRRDGEVLHPPFPDYYFANLVLERAKKIVVEPRPIAFQGVSKSSFGFTLFNQKTEEGFKVLGHELLQDELYGEVGHFILPGPGYNSQYIVTMAHLAKAIGDPLRRPDFARYRKIMVYQHLARRGFPVKWRNTNEAVALWKQLSFAEKCHAYYAIAVHRLSEKFRQLVRTRTTLDREMSMHDFAPIQYVLNEGDYLRGSEVFADIRAGRIRLNCS
jgi:glycosyltransferase involved in cell wall biosynthesis